MLTIGEFARFTGVSVRRLRHYDALGLLPPASVDVATGYRRYTAAQFHRLHRLLALQDLGFTLEQMGPVLDAQVGAHEMRAMLLARHAELVDAIEADRARLGRIEARLRLIEREMEMPDLQFEDKSLPAVLLAQITDEVERVEEIGARIGPMFGRLMGGVMGAGIEPAGANVAWYEGRGERTGIGAAVPIAEDARAEAESIAGVEVSTLSAVERAVTVVHHGAMDTIGETWQALETEVERRGLHAVGTCREVYLEEPQDNPDAWVTELQQPVG
ncbi:DNA-binding transcriptional MerR regulator [Nocardioides sp. BE266]|uniref:MerR family transcriptional regulator n=1 Tax=Nocardioides sp. BE266 TaxID=2817725 RepID=UPI00285C163A|nr:MerR family transcriptional regulator [Nocardioides sp. BE266]MDR7251680.1 DNA-binding transcriptional MerR regulator [Nocardioides sp. BE266]